MAGLARVPAEILVTVGRDVDPDELGAQPPHVRVEPYVDQAEVLPRCGLVVSHGGSGSLMGALEHGLPMVLTPLGADQPHNAARAAAPRRGDRPRRGLVHAQEVELSVTAMLTNRQGREAALAVKAEIDALPPVESTVPRLEALAGH